MTTFLVGSESTYSVFLGDADVGARLKAGIRRLGMVSRRSFVGYVSGVFFGGTLDLKSPLARRKPTDRTVKAYMQRTER